MFKRDRALHITVTTITFFILLSSGATTLIAMFFIRFFLKDFYFRLAPLTVTTVALIASTVIGTALTIFVSRYYFRPLDKLIKAQKQVAEGNFSVKVDTPASDNIISQLIKSFNSMTDELSNTEMFRNDFINNFSHEFKTPIVSIRGFAKQLQKGDLPQQQQEEYISIIVDESDRLASMATSILLLTRLENQQIVTNKSTFYLDEQIRKCILMQEKQWSKKNIELDLQLDEIKYYSNEEMVFHIWQNLISNAIKFTPENGKISIKCYGDTHNITVKVTDNGIGMSDATMRHIFDKFYQGDTSHTAIGNGLGLPLAKRVVDLLKGKISVKSQTGKGTTFIVRLPVDSPDNIKS